MDNDEVQCLRAMCIAKALQKEMEFQSPAFLGILRAVKSKDKDGQSSEDTSAKVEKIKREDLPDKTSGEYAKNLRQSFPKMYPNGVPPI